MFLYDEQGRNVGHVSPRILTPEERLADDQATAALRKRHPWMKAPKKKGQEPLELRFGKLEDPQAQVKLEWATEEVRKGKGEKAAENFYQLGIAAGQGKAELEKKFAELFPGRA